MSERIIGHLDMDAFFAAIEERNNPRWRGWPIVVGADPKNGLGRGVVATANYPAREYGIGSALPISRAWQLAEAARQQGKPAVIFLSGRSSNYAEVSGRIMGIIRERVPRLQQTGLDEAYFDLSFTGSFSRARVFSQKLKDEVMARERLTASVGIGPNKLLAKISSNYNKPDGLTVVTTAKAAQFLAPLPIRVLPGVGPKAEQRLQRHTIQSVGDVRRFSEGELTGLFGKWGAALYCSCRGLDDSPLRLSHLAKSIGKHLTFTRDTLDSRFIVENVAVMCEELVSRLREQGFTGFRTVVITVRFSDFSTRSRSYTRTAPTSSVKKLKADALRLLLPFFDRRENPGHLLVRLIGVRLEKLERA